LSVLCHLYVIYTHTSELFTLSLHDALPISRNFTRSIGSFTIIHRKREKIQPPAVFWGSSSSSHNHRVTITDYRRPVGLFGYFSCFNNQCTSINDVTNSLMIQGCSSMQVMILSRTYLHPV